MTLEEAITTALEYETRVRDAYRTAADQAGDKVGKKVFGLLGDEEQGHVDYLQSRLEEWQKTGKVTPGELETVGPSRQLIEEGMSKLDQHRDKPDRGREAELLSKALQLEKETSEFYRKMFSELGEEGALFGRFLEIEEGHLAIVQAEMDYQSNTGYMFDFQDFGIV